jgi:hypothetical protein
MWLVIFSCFSCECENTTFLADPEPYSLPADPVLWSHSLMPAKKSASKPRLETATADSKGVSKRRTVRRDVFGRRQILRKYWDLANLDPEVTKGSITGQLKALDSLREELVLSRPPAAEKDKTGASQDIYQSAWLRSTWTRAASGSVNDE